MVVQLICQLLSFQLGAKHEAAAARPRCCPVDNLASVRGIKSQARCMHTEQAVQSQTAFTELLVILVFEFFSSSAAAPLDAADAAKLA